MLGERLHVANLKAIRAWKKWYPEEPWELHTHPFDNQVEFYPCLGGYRKTRVFCSSPECCGNPRRRRGARRLTYQELKELDKAKHQLNELG
jgi:hypothetical protein